MSRLIDDLMDVSRITQGKIKLQRKSVDLSTVVQTALDAVKPQCERAGHAMTLGLSVQPLQIDGDPTRLAQVVVNIVGNACKFTPHGGRIWISTEREDNEAVLRVKDTGAGIALEDQTRIFEMFVQSAQPTGATLQGHGGLGIGLALVRQIVELHGGSVHVHSPGKGAGSEFIVRLPIAVRAATGSASPADAPRMAPARRILVVDDNLDAATTWRMC